MSYPYGSDDIAKTLKQAMAQGASYDDVNRLLTARNRKIEAGGEELAQYRDDDLTKDAQQYLQNKINKQDVDLKGFQAAREAAAAENLRIADEQNRRNYTQGIKQAASDAAAQRKALYSQYKRDSLLGGESLAANGLGRGAGKPSSGYGESARMEEYLNYQNGLADTYARENQQKTALYSDYMDQSDRNLSAYTTENAAIAKDYSDKAIDQRNKDRDYLLEESKHNAEVNRWNQAFDYDAEQDRADRTEKEKQAQYENALNMFKQTGTVSTEEQAKILGLPVGTKTLDRNDFEEGYTYKWSVFGRDADQFNQEMAYKQKAHEDEMAYKQKAHDEEMAYKYAVANSRRRSGSSSGSSSDAAFQRNFNLFKTVGEVITEEMADSLHIPKGTKYWQYVDHVADNERQNKEMDFKLGIW